jgi:hypothetical protein
MLSVKGSLRKHLSWWRENVQNQYIVNTIAEGYKLPLISIPEVEHLRNNKSARDNANFVSEEIQKLTHTGAITEVTQKPTVINALTVAIQASGKKRLVLDLRSVNPLLNVSHYTYEDINTASQYFKKGAYMCTFDLKSGYHHIDIHEAYQQYLGFEWEGKYYIFSVCPFGMAVSGLIFSKVLRELVRKW